MTGKGVLMYNNYRPKSNVKEVITGVLVCALMLGIIFVGVYIQLAMFDGDMRCLFVRCVIVK
jgi:hypothetical protein